MRAVLVVILGSLCLGQAAAQEFSSPLDVVSTLYNGYFMDVPLTDIGPYFSDELKARLDGVSLGSKQFTQAGLDPITGYLDWQPRELSISLIKQDATTARVKVSFKQRDIPAEIVLDVVREADHGWQIDHIAGKAGQQSWCTNSIVSMASDEHRARRQP